MKPATKTIHGFAIPENATVAAILGDLRKLPLLPTTVQQAMSLASQENCKIAQFTSLMEQDVTLASSVLKLANSPTFNCGRSIDCLDQAVIRLGTQECKNLMIAVSMRQLYSKSNPTTRGYCSVLWSHCFLTACFARRLNRAVGFNYHGEEFAAGLLHDLGRILLAVTMPDRFAELDPMDFQEDTDILEREREIIGTDHCELGSLYAEENALPFAVTTAIRDHHRFRDATKHRGILALVVTADHMANHVRRGEDAANYDPDKNPGFEFLTRVWSRDAIASFTKLAPQLIRETIEQSEQRSRTAAPCENSRSTPPESKPASSWEIICSWF